MSRLGRILDWNSWLPSVGVARPKVVAGMRNWLGVELAGSCFEIDLMECSTLKDWRRKEEEGIVRHSQGLAPSVLDNLQIAMERQEDDRVEQYNQDLAYLGFGNFRNVVEQQQDEDSKQQS